MKRKTLCLLLALVMMLVPFTALAADGSAAGQIVILHTNDVHCAIDQTVEEDGTVSAIGYAGVAAYLSEMQKEYGAGNVTLIDGGDAIQGGTIGTLSDGAYIVDIMNEVGYDIAIPGNHEFDYGMDQFLTLANSRAQYDYICCNFIDLTTGETVFDAYELVDYDGVTVAYVGISTPATFTSSTPAYFQNEAGEYIYSFCQGGEGEELYEAVQNAVDDARANGADYVVAIGHLGIVGSRDNWASEDVIANTTGIDAFIDAHSHEAYSRTAQNADGEEVVLAQTGTKLAAIGKLVIDTESGVITSELVENYSGSDAAVADFVAGIEDEFAAQLQEVVATSEVDLTVNDPETGLRRIRTGETNLGDFCADAYRAMLGADIAFVNGGGIRADIAAGEVTYEDIINVHPFGNEGCVVEATGQQILDALEMGVRNYPEESGGFQQVSGLTYELDASLPSSVVTNDMGEFVEVAGEYRVKNVMVGGEPLDLEGTYTLASHNYMLKDGGDGFTMFEGCKLLKDCVMIDNAMLINYVTEELGGVIGQEYADPHGQGRITILEDGAEEVAPGDEEVPDDEEVPGEEETPVEGGVYVVVKGDSLWEIAKHELGDSSRWNEIYELNRDTIRDPRVIRIGQEILLPAA